MAIDSDTGALLSVDKESMHSSLVSALLFVVVSVVALLASGMVVSMVIKVTFPSFSFSLLSPTRALCLVRCLMISLTTIETNLYCSRDCTIPER